MTNRSLVLLSGEGTTLPPAEAKALFLAGDPASQFEAPEPRVLLANSSADPVDVGSRIAFAKRVGSLVEDRAELAERLDGHRVRFRRFDLRGRTGSEPEKYLKGLRVTVDLRNPEYELTLVRGEQDYLSLTVPGAMVQGWSRRRPRARPFFHPSAIFPKLARALVNLSGCREGSLFLDPFSGTGSIPLEASLVGGRVVAADVADRMVRGCQENMKHFGQEWQGILRADSAFLPVRRVDAAATDIPYGRASSTRGRRPGEIMDSFLGPLAAVMEPRARLVLMHPQDLPAPRSREFSMREEHHLHVHKLLTRTITVLEKR